jgi:hypothetical protein
VSTTGLSSQKDTLLYTQQKKHVFSSQKKKDTFSLSVTGKNIFDSFVTFRITSWQGKVIYEHRFSMGDFKEFGPSETDKAYRRDSDDSIRILRSLDHFFDEESFTNPAIKDTMDMDANMEPREIWLPVWQDKTAIGFHYLLGAEDGRSIVYSKKKNMVITYFTCC